MYTPGVGNSASVVVDHTCKPIITLVCASYRVSLTGGKEKGGGGINFESLCELPTHV